MEYTAVILAGGRSRRFGEDKRLIDINGMNMIEMIVARCRELFSEILIVGGEFCVPGSIDVPDIYKGVGPLAGIHAGLLAASNKVCFVLACDMPNFSIPFVTRLIESSEGVDMVWPKSGRCVQPLYSVYDKSVSAVAENLIKNDIRKVSRLQDVAQVRFVEVSRNDMSPQNDIFFNMNYKADYELYKKAHPPIISVVGFSGVGKTTYLEKLIAELKRRNISVGVIKHDAHSFDIDIPGKDSYRLSRAGADITAVSSADKIAFIERVEYEADLRRLAGRMSGKVDIVLTEGFKREKALKIIVRRSIKDEQKDGAQCSGDLLDYADEEIFAIVSDEHKEGGVFERALPLDDARPMADLIWRFLQEGGIR